MAEQWKLHVEIYDVYGIPVVRGLLDDLWEVRLALSPTDPWSTLAPRAAEVARLTTGAGRRLIPTAAGLVIAERVTVQTMRLPALEGESLQLAPFTFALGNQAQTLGVGGILGVDFFSRFGRMSFQTEGSRRVLTLEE